MGPLASSAPSAPLALSKLSALITDPDVSVRQTPSSPSGACSSLGSILIFSGDLDEGAEAAPQLTKDLSKLTPKGPPKEVQRAGHTMHCLRDRKALELISESVPPVLPVDACTCSHLGSRRRGVCGATTPS